jgi:hypothetical protein
LQCCPSQGFHDSPTESLRKLHFHTWATVGFVANFMTFNFCQATGANKLRVSSGT